MLRAPVPSLTRNLMVLESRGAILALAPLLTQLAARCGQPGEMHWLRYFLDKEASGRRSLPRLLLFLRPENADGEALSADCIEAAALFFEYKVLGLRSGVMLTYDGFGSVLAPPGERTRVAVLAGQQMLERGASMVLTTLQNDGERAFGESLRSDKQMTLGLRQRKVGRALRLYGTLDETLAHLSRSTRSNLRYYRRKAERELGCTFLAKPGAALTEETLLQLNRDALNPVAEEEFLRRVRSARELPSSFLYGLRTRDGKWLSLAAGWSQGGRQVMHWQMNVTGYGKHSLSTVMRCFMLEQAIQDGASELFIYGGTSHPMHRSFYEEPLLDVLMCKRDWRSRLLPPLLRGTASVQKRFALRSNALTELLQSPQLIWAESVSERPRRAVHPLGPARGSQRLA